MQTLHDNSHHAIQQLSLAYNFGKTVAKRHSLTTHLTFHIHSFMAVA